MKLHSVWHTVICMAILIACIHSIEPAETMKSGSPETAASAFYSFHFAHDMAFTPDTIKQRRAWLTPGLLKACEAYFKLPEDPNEVPYIDGDVFTGSQEYPDSFNLGSAAIATSSARIPVTFSWKDGHSSHGTVVMKNIHGKWLLEDVEFPDQDSIRKLLSDALKQSN